MARVVGESNEQAAREPALAVHKPKEVAMKVECKCPSCGKIYSRLAKSIIPDRVNYKYCKKCYKTLFWDPEKYEGGVPDYNFAMQFCQGTGR